MCVVLVWLCVLLGVQRANGLDVQETMMWLVMAASLALCEADSPSVQLMV